MAAATSSLGLGKMESPTQTSPSWPMASEVMAGGVAGRVRGRIQVRVQEQAWKPESSGTKTLKAARQRASSGFVWGLQQLEVADV